MRTREYESTQSLWLEPELWPFRAGQDRGRRASQLRGFETEVVVVGAGIVGLTAALELKRAGKQVLVVDAGTTTAGESVRTTAHLTEVLDVRFVELVRRFGHKHAQLALAGQRHAIERIQGWVSELSIACNFERVPGYLLADAADPEQHATLEAERKAAADLGYANMVVEEAPAPFGPARALRFDNQAQLTPGPYLDALAAEVDGGGSLISRGVRVQGVEEVDSDRCKIITDVGVIFARHVVVAAHVPSNNRLFIHTKLSCHRTYVVAAPLERAVPPGLFWDLASPYHYVRTTKFNGRTFIVVGGEDHRVGDEEDTSQRFRTLIAYVRTKFGITDITHRWSGQIVESVDGLPYVGRNSREHNVYVATGFSGNGYTSGTLAGLILADAICGRENRWARLLAATRSPPLGMLGGYVGGNFVAAKHIVTDRFKSASGELDDIQANEGAILERRGERLAIYRDAGGALHAMSAVCPHLGCHVRWNRAEKSWDCPCHGSRFDCRGRVVNGPASASLEARQMEDDDGSHLAPALAPPAFTT